MCVETPQEKVTREAAEAKVAFAHIHEVVENAPEWTGLHKSGEVGNLDDGRNRHARKLRDDGEVHSWIKDHEDRQDSR